MHKYCQCILILISYGTGCCVHQYLVCKVVKLHTPKGDVLATCMVIYILIASLESKITHIPKYPSKGEVETSRKTPVRPPRLLCNLFPVVL